MGAAGLAAARTAGLTTTTSASTSVDTATAQQLGLLAGLAGTWKGTGFALTSRPDFHDEANTYLQLNQTRETLTITPIGAAVPNRGFGQDDIDLYGLNYLQRINDAATGASLHLEPGLWMTQPPTTYPPQQPDRGEQLIFRMGSIPHGTSLLAEGVAAAFTGPPTLETPQAQYQFSAFPSFNSTPIPLGSSGDPVVAAAGSSEKETAVAEGLAPGFQEYDVTVPASRANPRTPYRTDPPDPPLPAAIDGVPMQAVVNDPITLLQARIKSQVASGHTFSGVALNVATQPQVSFLQDINSKPTGSTTTVTLTSGGGALGNIPFLSGGVPTGAQGPNAQSVLFYATFWIERVTPPKGAPFMQLQYAQLAQLNFPNYTDLHPAPGLPSHVLNVAWPHVQVATLRKSFGHRS